MFVKNHLIYYGQNKTSGFADNQRNTFCSDQQGAMGRLDMDKKNPDETIGIYAIKKVYYLI